MKIRLSLFDIGYFIGCSITLILCIIAEHENGTYCKEIESIHKPTIDYKLEAKGKQIDTIWIYTFKKQ